MNISKFSLKTVSVLVLGIFIISSCSSGPTRPEDIKPTYFIRNSPIPVPYPNEKPTPPPRPGTSSSSQATATLSSSDQTITVQKGDTVYAISQRTGVDTKSIIAANRLKPPYTLHPGDRLVLTGGVTHIVKRGETSYGISRAYGVDLHSLIRANNLRTPYTLEIGQALVIPGGLAQQQRTVLDVPIPPREGGRFLWPLRGQILSGYGPKDGGLHNDGINIKAQRGDPVKAAEAGVVVYADDGLKGYGNLLLIRHAGGWVTAYAHNDRLLVKRGDQVGKGDVIAWAGISGGVSEPQLHFEIRKGTAAVNPVPYLDG